MKRDLGDPWLSLPTPHIRDELEHGSSGLPFDLHSFESMESASQSIGLDGIARGYGDPFPSPGIDGIPFPAYQRDGAPIRCIVYEAEDVPYHCIGNRTEMRSIVIPLIAVIVGAAAVAIAIAIAIDSAIHAIHIVVLVVVLVVVVVVENRRRGVVSS
jgi:hypothetical protein